MPICLFSINWAGIWLFHWLKHDHCYSFMVCFPPQKFSRVSANELGVNVSNQDGFTPLHMAALHGHGELAALLLRHGASASAKNAQLAAPLHLACQKGHCQVPCTQLPDTCHPPAWGDQQPHQTSNRDNELGGSGFCLWCLESPDGKGSFELKSSQ